MAILRFLGEKGLKLDLVRLGLRGVRTKSDPPKPPRHITDIYKKPPNPKKRTETLQLTRRVLWTKVTQKKSLKTTKKGHTGPIFESEEPGIASLALEKLVLWIPQSKSSRSLRTQKKT